MERQDDTLIERPTEQMPSLNKYEIACVTSGIPVTGDPLLDRVITLGQRTRMATEVLAQLRANVGETVNYDPEALASEAIKLADALLKKLRG